MIKEKKICKYGNFSPHGDSGQVELNWENGEILENGQILGQIATLDGSLNNFPLQKNKM